jgi:dTDP-4-dehydrorhamnose 3,5-epimerase-like enzyme
VFPEVDAMATTSARSSGLIDLPKISDSKGNLTFIESFRHVPFEIRRVYYTYDVPGGAVRGGHAHRRTEEFIIAASGSFDVVLEAGDERQHYFLNRSYRGLYVPLMTWRELENFSSGSVCLVLASELFEESDYIRDHDEYRRTISTGRLR